MFELLLRQELPRGARVKRCPEARLHWAGREASPRLHQSPRETAEGRHSVKTTSLTLSQDFQRFYFPTDELLLLLLAACILLVRAHVPRNPTLSGHLTLMVTK